MKRDEITSGILLFLFGAITAVLSLKMPIGNFRSAGTGLFPLCLGILLMFLSLLHMVKIVLNKKTLIDIEIASHGAQVVIKNVVLFLTVVVLSISFFNTIGYLVFSFLLMLLLIRVLGERRWVFNIILSLITAVASYLLFVKWLKIPLPRGLMGF